jgi:hypothetical protein
LVIFINVSKKVAAALIKLIELRLFESNISQTGPINFFTSYLFGSFLIILERHIIAFFRTAVGDRLVIAISMIESDSEATIALGTIVAMVEKASD